MGGRGLLLALLGCAAGCGPPLDPPSLVTRLRVLAVRANLPEAHPGDTIALDALVVMPSGTLEGGSDAGPDATSIDTLWIACTPPPGSTDVKDCAAQAATTPGGLPPDCAAAPEAPVCVVGATPSASLLIPADAPAPASRYLVMIVATTSSGGPVGCLERVAGGGSPEESCVISLKTVTLQPAGVPLNQNPSVASFTVDGQDVHNLPRVALHQKVALLPTFSGDAAAEAELKPDGTHEILTFSWFATQKDFDHFHSGFALPPAPPERPDNAWTDEGDQPGQVYFWLVLRDDRGGVGWTSAQLGISAP